MLEVEARWLGQVLDGIESDELSPLLNLGSATAEFRQRLQPWIDQWIFAPLRGRGVEVHHLDIQGGGGVDLCGDLTDDAFVAGLVGRGYRGLLCCNLLEHIPDPSAMCAKLERLLALGGYIMVTVPHRFPYHPDPIDTMFRPTVEDLARLFPHCFLVEGAVLDGGTGWDYVERNPRVLVRKVKQRLTGLSSHGGLRGSASFLPWLFRRFRQTCAVLRRQQGRLIESPAGE